MGLFYLNETANDKEQERQKELEEIALETLSLVDGVDNKVFPEFIWEPQINDFVNDDYRIRGSCTNPQVIKAYSIRRKYNDYWDYIDALESYMEFVKYADAVYGSFEMMRNAARLGIKIISIPSFPKLSNKKKNRVLLEGGFMPSRVDDELEVDSERKERVISEIKSVDVCDDEDYRIPKINFKLQEKAIKKQTRSARVGSIFAYNSQSNLSFDAIINFLNSPNQDQFESRGGDSSSSMMDKINNLHENDYIDEEILSDSLTPQHVGVIANGAFIKTADERQIKIIETLEREGFNFLNSTAASALDKHAVRMLTKKLNRPTDEVDYSQLSKKEIKKLKKKEAKRRKRAREQLIGDRRIQETLLRNKIHIGTDEMTSFRFADVFGKEFE